MAEPSPFICLQCEQEFSPLKGNQTYCNRKCKTRAADKRRREKYAEDLKKKSREYYLSNKEKWDTYRETQEAKIESDPDYAERAKEWQKNSNQNYHKTHPGYNALKQERQKEKKGKPRRDDVLRPFSSQTLMATARLLVKEAKMASTLDEGLILQQAAQILTATAMMRLRSKKKD